MHKAILNIYGIYTTCALYIRSVYTIYYVHVYKIQYVVYTSVYIFVPPVLSCTVRRYFIDLTVTLPLRNRTVRRDRVETYNVALKRVKVGAAYSADRQSRMNLYEQMLRAKRKEEENKTQSRRRTRRTFKKPFNKKQTTVYQKSHCSANELRNYRTK
jgi:hypothetical protein